jgi:hypothetical protein
MNFGKWLENRDDFVKYHKTGNISSSAYTAYDKLEQEYGKNWFKPNFKEWLNEVNRILTAEEKEIIIDMLTDPTTESKALAQKTSVASYIAKFLGLRNAQPIIKRMRKYGIDPSITAKSAQSARAKERWESPEYRTKMSALTKKQWEDPEFKKLVVAAKSASSKKLWEDPEYREFMLEILKAAREKNWEKNWNNPAFRTYMSSKMEKKWEEPEFRAKATQNNPMVIDFWNKMAEFPPEKQEEILNAMFHKRKNRRNNPAV